MNFLYNTMPIRLKRLHGYSSNTCNHFRAEAGTIAPK